MSNIIKANKDINVAEGDFAKKLREVPLGEAPRGEEIAIRREVDPSTILFRGEKIMVGPVSFFGAVTMDVTLFGKAISDDAPPRGDFLSAEQVVDFTKRR